MICWRSSHILRNISRTFMTWIIYILSSWLFCRLRDQEDILGCIMGLRDRQPWSLHKHHQQWGPVVLHASSFQECDAKRRLGWDWREQRHDFMDHSHPWRYWQFPDQGGERYKWGLLYLFIRFVQRLHLCTRRENRQSSVGVPTQFSDLGGRIRRWQLCVSTRRHWTCRTWFCKSC